MSTPSRLLQGLDPPAAGWQRLVRRRNKESWLTPVGALTGAAAVVALALSWPHGHRIELKLDGARLIGEHSEGITLRMLDNQKAVALPSRDPNVELYLIDGTKAQQRK